MNRENGSPSNILLPFLLVSVVNYSGGSLVLYKEDGTAETFNVIGNYTKETLNRLLGGSHHLFALNCEWEFSVYTRPLTRKLRYNKGATAFMQGFDPGLEVYGPCVVVSFQEEQDRLY